MAYVQAVERHTGRDITRVPIFSPDFAWSLEQARQDRDFPIYPNGFMLIGMAERMAADGSRVIINGQGGDMWLDGHQSYYREELAGLNLADLMRSLSADIAGLGLARTLSLFARSGLFDQLPERVKTLLRSAKSGRAPDPLETQFWLSDDMLEELAARKVRFDASLSDIPTHLQYKIDKHCFPFNVLCLESMSRFSARVGAEHRAPLMSRKFIEFSSSTPEWTRLHGGVSKYIHRRALSNVLPAEIVQRADKASFDTTFAKYDAAIQEFCPETQDFAFASMIDRPALERFFATYCNAAIDEGAIWEIWRNYVGAVITRMPTECD